MSTLHSFLLSIRVHYAQTESEAALLSRNEVYVKPTFQHLNTWNIVMSTAERVTSVHTRTSWQRILSNALVVS